MSGRPIRSKLVRAMAGLLTDAALGLPVLEDVNTGQVVPPYVLIRAGNSQAMTPGQCTIEEISLYVAVSHDADTIAAEAAETASEEYFAAALGDISAHAILQDMVVSIIELIGVEVQIHDHMWHHIGVFRAIVDHAPPE